MSSSEQASEPTMDEILTSIRKIISDDEPGEAPQPEAAASETAAPEPEQDGLADDLANALNATQAETEAADDVLDLTNVVAGQTQDESPQEDALQAALGDALPSQDADAATEQAAGDADISAVLAQAGIEPTAGEKPSEPQPAVASPADELIAVLEQDDAAQPEADSTEATSITDVLAAIEQPAAAAPDASMDETADVSAADPAPESSGDASLDTVDITPEVEAAPVDELVVVPAPEAAPEAAAPADVDAEMDTGDIVAEAAAEPEIESVETPAEATDELAEPVQDAAPVEEVAPAEAAAPAPAGGEGSAFEESVKDMLRPMLSQWLDENLERIVQQEVAAANLKDGGS